MRVQKVQKVQKERFLGLTGLWPEGGGIALTGDEYEVSVTGFAFVSLLPHDVVL